jgi:hypothetical protein
MTMATLMEPAGTACWSAVVKAGHVISSVPAAVEPSRAIDASLMVVVAGGVCGGGAPRETPRASTTEIRQ